MVLPRKLRVRSQYAAMIGSQLAPLSHFTENSSDIFARQHCESTCRIICVPRVAVLHSVSTRSLTFIGDSLLTCVLPCLLKIAPILESNDGLPLKNKDEHNATSSHSPENFLVNISAVTSRPFG